MFDLLVASLASNKSQQHISSGARDTGRQLGWSRAKLLSVLISYCRITDYAGPGESSLPRVTRGPPRTCTKHTGPLPTLPREYVSKTIQISSSPFPFFLCCNYKEDEGIYFSHTKDRMRVYYKFDNKNFITKIKCG